MIAIGMFAVVMVLIGWDLYVDYGEGSGAWHLGVEFIVFLVALAGIERQFERWDLPVAEKDVALLLLKGLSYKEIAIARDTSERTVREQGRAVYRKSGLGGRSELSAFFLEDLLLPHR